MIRNINQMIKLMWDEIQSLKARVNSISTPNGEIRFGPNPIVGLLPQHTHQGTGEGGQVDHGDALIGLADDDHCFSEDTELLTDRGFLKYEDIAEGERALTLNLDTNELQYQVIRGKYVYDNFQEMVSFRNRFGEILVTKNHRMIFQNTTNPLKKNPSREWFECTAQDALTKSVFVIPTGGHSTTKELPISDRFAELLGLIISEGHFIDPKKGGYGVILYQSEGGNADYIRRLLDDLRVPYTYHAGQNEKFYIRSPWARKHIRAWLDRKNIPDRLMQLRGQQFLWFLSGLILGDGSVRTNKPGHTDKIDALKQLRESFDGKIRYSYHSADKTLIDKLAHLCTLNGLSAYAYHRNGGFKNGCWSLNIKNSRTTLFSKGTKSITPYTGKVWCVSVPNKTLVLRRNGFIFVAGNTQYALLAGRSTGQTLIGGTGSGEDLTLQSTAHATKGKILFGTSAYDEVNNRLGIGTATPAVPLDVIGAVNISGNLQVNGANIGITADTDLIGLASGVVTIRGGASDGLLVNTTTGGAGILVTSTGQGILGPQIDLYQDSQSIAILDRVGGIRFRGNNADDSNVKVYGSINSVLDDVTQDAEAAKIRFHTFDAGKVRVAADLTGGGQWKLPVKGSGAGIVLGRGPSIYSDGKSIVLYDGAKASFEFAIDDVVAANTVHSFRGQGGAGDNLVLNAVGTLYLNYDYGRGVVVGAPSGGNKGAGTLNAGGVFDDNVLLTDYVFEDDYPLLAISEMREYIQKYKHLPTLHGFDWWEEHGKPPIGIIANQLTETVEVQARYILELEERVVALETGG